MSLNASPHLLLLSFFIGSGACSASGASDPRENQGDGTAGTGSGGSVAEIPGDDSNADNPNADDSDANEPASSSGGFGGEGDDSKTEAEISHPLFGAGSYPSTAPSDPCIAAQRWEESTNLDLTTGALILHDGVVYEVTGKGETEATWADEWTAPPCTRNDGHCEALAYQVVVTCD